MDLIKPLTQLSLSRKVFHSEADFQFALAWEIQKIYPSANVRLEYCPADIKPTMHIDVFVSIDGYRYPIELKYKKNNFKKKLYQGGRFSDYVRAQHATKPEVW